MSIAVALDFMLAPGRPQGTDEEPVQQHIKMVFPGGGVLQDAFDAFPELRIVSDFLGRRLLCLEMIEIIRGLRQGAIKKRLADGGLCGVNGFENVVQLDRIESAFIDDAFAGA